MRSIRVLLVGLVENEINQCEQIQGVISPNFYTLPVDSTTQLEKIDLPSMFDQALIACRAECDLPGIKPSDGNKLAHWDFAWKKLNVGDKLALRANLSPTFTTHHDNSQRLEK